MKVLIVGLGLMGGSFARAIKSRTGDVVAGLDADPAALQKALACGAIDEAVACGAIDEAVACGAIDEAVACGAIDEAVAAVPPDADVVLLALYPRAAVEFVRAHRDALPAGCMVIDLCGVKRYVCREIGALLAGRDVTFIGGHPMAGREFFGFDASREDLFDGASMILTPDEGLPRNQWLFAELFFQRLGFARVTRATPDEHDRMIALTSQLAHVVSSAYVQNPAAARHAGFSAGSFHDMTRVARLHEVMWAELFMLNGDYLADDIDRMVEMLETFQRAIRAGDEAGLRAMLQKGRLIKEALNRE